MFEISSFGPKRRLLLLGCGFFSGNSAAMLEKNLSPRDKIHPFGTRKRNLNMLLMLY